MARTRDDIVAALLMRASGLWAVYVARAGGADEVGVARNVGLRVKRAGGADALAVFWCASKADAMAIAAAARAAGKPVEIAIREAAQALHIAVAPSEAVEARVAVMAKIVLARAEEMRRRGDLREIHQSYKRLRAARAKAGRSPISYNSFLYRTAAMMFVRAMRVGDPDAWLRTTQLRGD